MSRQTRGSVSEKGDASCTISGDGEGLEGAEVGKLVSKEVRKMAKAGGQRKGSTDSVCRGGFSKVCGKALKETDCVSCDICQRWFHPACQKLSPSAFSALCHYEFFWSCDICRIKLPDIIEAGKSCVVMNQKIDEMTKLIEEHQKAVKEQLGEVTVLLRSQKDEQASSAKKISDLEKSMEDVSTTLSGEASAKKKLEVSLKKILKDEGKTTRDELTEAMSALGRERKESRQGGPASTQMQNEVAKSVKECIEQEKRRKNIVVHNLKEPDAELSVEGKQEDDKHTFQEMCKETMRLNTRVEKTFRVGKSTSGRPRLLIVVLEEEATKWEVLRMARNLRDVECYNNIYITPDLTPEEQARDKALRQELKRRRAAGEMVEIRRGRIVIKRNQEVKDTLTDPTTEAGQVETIPKRVE